MSSAPSSLPSPVELENLGVLFIGFVATTVLYGLTFFQGYIYYSRYPKDYPWIRYLVVTVCALDTIASALVSEVLYYYLIIMFDVNMDVLYATTTFCIQYMLSVLLTFISQIFFVYRVFQVTGGSRLLTLILIFLTFIALVFGLTATAQLFVQRRLSAFGSLQMEVTAAISLAASMTADMIIFATMRYSLRPARYPEMVVLKGFVPTIATLFVGRGLAFTIIQTAYFCVFLAGPSKPTWIAFQMIASKLYINTLLGHLNSREVKHGQGFNEEDSLTDRKSPIQGQFPASIRLNVTDAKATTQSIRLTTRHTDTDSDVTGLESRKTYNEDSHGHIYAEISTGTGSSQSQPDNEADKGSLSQRIE